MMLLSSLYETERVMIGRYLDYIEINEMTVDEVQERLPPLKMK